jgi:hypothetical protein
MALEPQTTFTHSVEFEGMTLCFVNPELMEEVKSEQKEQATPQSDHALV